MPAGAPRAYSELCWTCWVVTDGRVHRELRTSGQAAARPRGVRGYRAKYCAKTPGSSRVSNASAVWQGGLKDGQGRISTESGVLSEARYGFTTRFENEPWTSRRRSPARMRPRSPWTSGWPDGQASRRRDHRGRFHGALRARGGAQGHERLRRHRRRPSRHDVRARGLHVLEGIDPVTNERNLADAENDGLR
jgi:hypothetical protein